MEGGRSPRQEAQRETDQPKQEYRETDVKGGE